MSIQNLFKLDAPVQVFRTDLRQLDAAPPPTPDTEDVDILPVTEPQPDRRVTYRPITLAGHNRSPDDLRRDYASGGLSGPQFLTKMARSTGLPQVHFHLTPPDTTLSGLLSPEFCLRHECLPWRMVGDKLWIATARPEAFPHLAGEIADHIAPLSPSILPVIVDREACQHHIARTHSTRLTERIRSRVPLQFSCRAWKADSRMRVISTGAAALLFAGLCMQVPAFVTSLLISIAFVTIAVASLMKTISAVSRLTDRRPDPQAPRRIARDTLPKISVLVPLFRERRIAETLLKRLKRLDYPREKLDILLVLEEEDTVTRTLLDRTPLPPGFRVVTVPDGSPRTKPRAMNYALDFCDGEIIGIYDAEDAPDPDQLLRVAAGFEDTPEDVVCLQGMLDYYNPRSTWIARCFTIEYNTWFRLILPGMGRLGFALPLGGTTLFFRRDKLEELGGWDAHNVTEDADLGFRLARAGYRTVVINTTTREEANERALPWIRQRSRWLKGYLATYLVHMRSPAALWRDLGPWQFLGFQAHFVTALAHFTLAPIVLGFWLVMLGIDLPYTTLDSDPRFRTLAFALLGQEILTMALGAIATQRGGHRNLWAWVPMMHLYWPMGTIAMWKALYELVFKPFYWDKTEHGHSLENETPAPQLTVPIEPESSFSRVTKAREI